MRSFLAGEFRTILKHGGSILAGQLAAVAFGVTDTLVAGHYSDQALAALSVGSSIFITVNVTLMGIVQALMPLYAELHGGQRHAAVGRAVRQGVYLCLLCALVGVLFMMAPAPFLQMAKVPAALEGVVKSYLSILAISFLPAILFRLYGTLNQSLGRPLMVTWLQLGALGIKVPLSIWLVGGGAGVPPLGAVGCAWATFIVNYGLLAVAIATLRLSKVYRPYRIWAAFEAPDWTLLRTFARLGIPGGLAYMVDVSAFALMALFIARLGTQATAAHQIAASSAALLYMTPLSIALACSSRVSYWIGASMRDKARQVIGLALCITGGIALLLCGLVVTFNHQIAAVFTPNAIVASVASGLLLWVALYHLADAMQALCAFLLRCYRVTFLPLLAYAVFLWGLGLYGGYRLAYEGLPGLAPLQSAQAFWICTALGMALVASSLGGLLWWVIRADKRA